ncbi:unnamed protein product [Alternaria sp. RS040]
MNSEALLESKQSATGSTVNSSRNNQHPPLWLAAKNGKEDEVAELVFSTSEWRKTIRDPDGRTALWWAVSTGQARIAGFLLATGGFDVNERPSHYCGLLKAAVSFKHVAVTKLLLDQNGLDVNKVDTWRRDGLEAQTSLHLAANRGLEEMVKLLLSHPDIDVNSQGPSGRTPLHAATNNGCMEIIVLLLAHPGIDVNSLEDYGGGTPLHAAASHNYMEILVLLLARPDVDVNLQDRSGDTPLHIAARRGCKEIFVLLLAQADIDLTLRNSSHHTPLYLAAYHGHEELVGMLLDKPESEARLDIGQNKYRGSPLLAAAKNGHRGVVKLLLARNGTGPGFRNLYGATPLHLAAEGGYKGVVDELLATSDSKDMVNLQDKKGETPLHRAASGGYEDCVIALMDRADVNVQDQELRTPLHRAVREEHRWVVKHLLKKPGILIHVSDKDGYTPLHLALRMGHESVARQLLEGSGFGKNPKDTYSRALLSCATQTGNAPMLKLLLESLEPNDIADINALDENGQTLLWSAVKRQDIDVMELLLTKDEVTLHLLVQRGEWSSVRVLLKAGYNVDIRDNLGRSALHIATILGHFDIAKSLVSFGASVDCKDGRGNTALRLAIQRKRCNFVDMLLESSADITGVRKHEWLDAYGQEIPDAVCLVEQMSGEKTIRSIKAVVIPDIIRQMHNAPKTERRLM